MGWIEIWTALAIVIAPTDGVSSQRVALLDELRAATGNECSGHDELIDRYDAAVDAAVDEEDARRLRVGRLLAYALRRAQAGRVEDDVWMLREAAAIEAADSAGDAADELRVVRDALEEPPMRVCIDPQEPGPPMVEAEVPSEPADLPRPREAEPRPSSPASTLSKVVDAPVEPARWSRRETVLVATGAGVGAAGLGALATGVSGPFFARARISGAPSPEQQQFLDQAVPRRSAVWTSVGATLVGAGASLVVAGLVQRRCRRTERC